jgi:ketosteroid isomerase-like protein
MRGTAHLCRSRAIADHTARAATSRVRHGSLMGAAENLALVRRLVDAYAAADIGVIDELLHDEVIFHVPGRHPLSGTYTGKAEVFGYLGRVASTSDSVDGGFSVHSLMADDAHVVGLVSGTIEHAGRRFVRPVVHVFHVDGAQITEFWEASLDQHAEDDFWNFALR